MKPRSLLEITLESRFVPQMEEHGFNYSKSQIKFSRRVDGNVQAVTVSLSKWNSEDDCMFWTVWSVTSPRYAKWYKERWGTKPSNSSLGGCADWNIASWSRGPDEHFRLKNSTDDQAEITCLWENVVRHGFPYLDKINTWIGAAPNTQQGITRNQESTEPPVVLSLFYLSCALYQL